MRPISIVAVEPTDRPNAIRRAEAAPVIRTPMVVCIASLLGLFSSLLAWQLSGPLDAKGLMLLVGMNFAYWYIWALFTPVVVCLSRRFRLDERSLALALAVHVPAAVILSVVHVLAFEGFNWWLATSAAWQYDWPSETRRTLLQNFDWEMMTYWAIVGLTHAVLNYRGSKERELQAAQLETRLAEARLQALQQQLHPHFLFNTLHAVSSLMHTDVEAADRMLTRLSDLLRITLESAEQPAVTLKAEIEFLQKYVEIEQMRFADRLRVTFDIAADTLDAMVPTLILQPLVENSVRHGIGRRREGGHITISARHEGTHLVLEVSDDGVGLSESALIALHKGIGVSTTHARLAHQYGAAYRFEFRRRSDGLTVIVAIPFRGAPAAAVPEPAAEPPRARRLPRYSHA